MHIEVEHGAGGSRFNIEHKKICIRHRALCAAYGTFVAPSNFVDIIIWIDSQSDMPIRSIWRFLKGLSLQYLLWQPLEKNPYATFFSILNYINEFDFKADWVRLIETNKRVCCLDKKIHWVFNQFLFAFSRTDHFTRQVSF